MKFKLEAGKFLDNRLTNWVSKNDGEILDEQGVRYYLSQTLHSPLPLLRDMNQMIRTSLLYLPSRLTDELYIPKEGIGRIPRHEMGHVLCDPDLEQSGGQVALALGEYREKVEVGGAYFPLFDHEAVPDPLNTERFLCSVVGSQFTDNWSSQDGDMFNTLLCVRGGTVRNLSDIDNNDLQSEIKEIISDAKRVYEINRFALLRGK